MRIDVLLGEAPVTSADVADRVVAVIDVLRAATTVASALPDGRGNGDRGDGARVAELVGRPVGGGIAKGAHEAVHARTRIGAGFEPDGQAGLTLEHFERVGRYHDRHLQLDAMIAPR